LNKVNEETFCQPSIRIIVEMVLIIIFGENRWFELLSSITQVTVINIYSELKKNKTD
jgi:hypothetical protein